MKQDITRGRRYVSFQIKEIQNILKSDEETKNVNNKLGSIEKEGLKKSLNMLIKTREEIVRKYKQTRVEKAIQLAKKTNEGLLNSLKPVFAEAINLEESFESFYEKKKKKKK